jgi:hypothetical protein
MHYKSFEILIKYILQNLRFFIFMLYKVIDILYIATISINIITLILQRWTLNYMDIITSMINDLLQNIPYWHYSYYIWGPHF